MIGVLAIVFILGLILSVPIALTMLLASLVPSLMDASFSADVIYIVRGIIGGADSTTILAVPLFMLSGVLMAQGGISEKLFNVFCFFFGKLRAGLPCTVVITCLFYGAISGSGPATCAAVGAMAIPVLVKMGYEKDFAGAICGTAGGLGVIIPPSIPFILYGLATGASIGSLFLAGIIPGILVALCLCGYCVYYCGKHGEDKEKINAMVGELRSQGFVSILKESIWALITPVIILGGIYSGIVTPTEAACISVFYSLIVSLFIYRSVKPAELIPILCNSVNSYAPLCLMLALATVLGRVLTLLQLPNLLSEFIVNNVGNKYLFLFVLVVILLILGMFMDCAPAIMILGPMLLPVATAMGISEIHLGVIMVVTLAVGFITPPFGVNLFVASRLVEVPVMKLGKRVMPFIGSFILALALITYVPGLSLAFVGGSSSSGTSTASSGSDTSSGDSGEVTINEAFLEDDAPTYTIMLAHATSESQLGGLNCTEFAEKVEERSNGKITVEVYPNGQLGSDAENFTSTQSGNIQMCWGVSGSFSSYITDLNVLSMPMRFDDVEECYALCADGTEFREYMNNTFEENGLVLLGLHPTAFRTMTSSKAVNSYEDFKGLDLRVMDDQYQLMFWDNVGCNATPLAWSETYIALQQGLMDAQENPLDNAVTSNLYEVQKYIVPTYHVAFVSCFMINKDFYESMPEEYQELVSSVVLEIAEEDLADYDNATQANLDYLTEQGMEICSLSDEDYEKLREAAEPVWEAMEEDLGDVVEAFNNTLENLDVGEVTINEAFLEDDAPTYTIMLAHATSESQLGGLNCTEFAEKVEERSNGKITVEVYPNGQLGSDAENFTSTQSGNIQMCWGVSGSFSSYITDLNVLSMPMRFDDVEECYALCADGTEFREYMNNTFEENGLVLLGLHPTAFRTMTSSKAVNSYEDFKGLDLRVMDDQYQLMFWDNVGCNATPLAWSETYTREP